MPSFNSHPSVLIITLWRCHPSSNSQVSDYMPQKSQPAHSTRTPLQGQSHSLPPLPAPAAPAAAPPAAASAAVPPAALPPGGRRHRCAPHIPPASTEARLTPTQGPAFAPASPAPLTPLTSWLLPRAPPCWLGPLRASWAQRARRPRRCCWAPPWAPPWALLLVRWGRAWGPRQRGPAWRGRWPRWG